MSIGKEYPPVWYAPKKAEEGGYPAPGLKVPSGRSLMAGSEEDVKMLGVNAVFEAEDTDVGDALCTLALVDAAVLSEEPLPSLAGVLRSELAGEALGDAAL